jgi:hypothetical protein
MGSPLQIKLMQWLRQPSLAPPWFRYPPHTQNDDGEIHEFLRFNPGWIKTSARELVRKYKIGNDKPKKVADRAKNAGHIEDYFIGCRNDFYVKPRNGHSGM